MARKLILMGLVGVAAFYLLAAPKSAANAVTHSGSLVRHTGHQIATFLRALG